MVPCFKSLNCRALCIKKNEKCKYNILIDLNDRTLYIIDKKSKKVVKNYPVAPGKPETPSPVGTWKVISKGEWSDAFGTRWIGLDVPWGRYGIHGTNRPSSVGRYASHGCIRMFNKDVEEVYRMIDLDSTVVIYGGPYDMGANKFRVLAPGDRGSDVLEIQRVMKNKGYYEGSLDGIYGEGMKAFVIKYRKDNKLTISHYIDEEFYNSIGITPFE